MTTEYGITEKDVAGAPPLSAVIRQFDRLAREVLAGGENLTLVTDGQLHLRQCLWPEVTRKNLSLPPYFSRFHDLRKEFQSVQPADPGAEHLSVEDMLKSLELEEDDSQEPALRTVNNMAAVVVSLLGQGRRLHPPEEIMASLEPGIRSRSEQVRGEQSLHWHTRAPRLTGCDAGSLMPSRHGSRHPKPPSCLWLCLYVTGSTVAF